MFLSEHPGDYIVFDDDKTGYKYEQDNLVLINCNTGLTTKDVKGVKWLLVCNSKKWVKNICKTKYTNRTRERNRTLIK